VKFLVDHQLPPALAHWLVGAGHLADHVAGLGLERASDDVIWRQAIRTGAVIICKDEDFSRRRTLAIDGPPVVWVRPGNCRTAALLQAFWLAMPHVVKGLLSGETLVERL